MPPDTLKTIPAVVINDVDGNLDKNTTKTYNLEEYFHPPGLTYTLDVKAPVDDRVSVMLDGPMLVVSLKDNATHQDDTFTIKAEDAIGVSKSQVVTVRRNRPPVTGANGIMTAITVGTQATHDDAAGDVKIGMGEAEGAIVILIEQPAGESENAYDFADDTGDSITLVGEANVGDRHKLSITDGGMLTIIGTAAADAGNIIINVRAKDSGDLMSDSRAIITVTVNPGPTAKGTIGNVGIKEGVALDVMSFEDVRSYFNDKSALISDTTHVISAWSDDPKIAAVVDNVANARTAIDGIGDAIMLAVRGVAEGEATITIRLTETVDEANNDINAADELGQWAEQTILVRVTRN